MRVGKIGVFSTHRRMHGHPTETTINFINTSVSFLYSNESIQPNYPYYLKTCYLMDQAEFKRQLQLILPILQCLSI